MKVTKGREGDSERKQEERNTKKTMVIESQKREEKCGKNRKYREKKHKK